MKNLNKEQIDALLLEMSKKVRQEHFSKGLPITYMNKDRWIVREYPDGRIEKIKQV